MDQAAQPASQHYGIKETQELAIGAIALGFHIVKLLKDGFQAADVGALMLKLQTDPEFAAKLKAAQENVGEVPKEIKDIDLNEGLQLGMAVVPAVVKEIQGMK